MRTVFKILLSLVLITGLVVPASSVQAAATITVCDSGCDHTTIQAAIDAAGAGDTINVYPGSYDETAAGKYLFNATGPYQFGLFIPAGKDGLTIQGVAAGGDPITAYADVAADVTTNATNSFGYSGIFVEADDVTISGLEILDNDPSNNKTFEVIGDNFTLQYSHINASDGGSVYFNDWRFDEDTDTSYVQSYTVEGNWLDHGASIDLTSGAGYSGDAANRKIINNTFTNDGVENWPFISFNGSDTGVPWFVYSVGGAVITGNDFTNLYTGGGVGAAFIRARGTYDNAQFNWASYWADNTFNKAVVFGPDPATGNVGTYSYTSGPYTFNTVRRIGVGIQNEIGYAASGDKVLVKPGMYTEAVTVDKSLTLEGAQFNTDVSGRTAANANESTIQGLVTISANDVTINGFTLTNPNQAYALLVPSNTPSHTNIDILYNIVDTVGGVAFASNVHAVYLNRGADQVTIANNLFNNLSAAAHSVSAVGVLDSASTNTSEGLIVQNNTFSNISSGTKGAYGVILNNGSNQVNGGVPGAQILDNTFSNFNGGWTHAIGLETKTENAVVTGNVFSNLTAGGFDNSAIFFEKNPFGDTVTVTDNEFNGNSFFGVAIHPNDLPGGTNGLDYIVNAENNWWNNDNGPLDTLGTVELPFTPEPAVADMLNSEPDGNLGASVGENVDYYPWTVTTKTTLDVTADNQVKFTDEPDLQEEDFTFKYSGFVGDDDESDIDTPPTCTVTGNQAVPGLLDIVCSGGADDNYDFNYINGTLTVSAANNEPTDISLSNNTVDENAASGTTVGQLSTTDDDVTDTFTYTLVNGGGSCPGTDNASFQIDGDLLKTNAVFDFETKDTYVICIETDDDQGGTFEKEFIITVNDIEELLSETTTFRSQAKNDGWILESARGSKKGGSKNNTAKTLRLGDTADNRQYRSIFSFNTASLPDDANITSVTLRVKRQTGVITLRGIMVDIRKGTFGKATLQLSDFNAKAHQTLGSFNPPAVSNWYTINLTPAASNINTSGLTQIRLRFRQTYSNNDIANILTLLSGNSTLSNRPQLVIEYEP